MRIAFVYEFDDKGWPGGRNYYASLFSAIHQVAPELQLVFFTGHKTVTTLPEQFPFLEVVRVSTLDRRSVAWIGRQVGRSLARTTDPALVRLLQRSRIDVLSHSGGLPNRHGIKTLGWLPDFQFFYFPRYWQPGQLRRTRRNYSNASRYCDALVVSSNDALADLKKFAPAGHVPAHVLHFVAAPAAVDQLPSLEQITAKYQLPPAYLHLPNQFWVHKNHRIVIEALARLVDKSLDVTVACTGQPSDFRNPTHFQELVDRARDLGVDRHFRVLGLVPYSDMQALMLHARAIINPSRFEGWSTTVEEAKALGKYILLSDLPVHREQAPTNVEYFLPDDADLLGQLMHRAIASEPCPVDAGQIAETYCDQIRQFGANYVEILRAL